MKYMNLISKHIEEVASRVEVLEFKAHKTACTMNSSEMQVSP